MTLSGKLIETFYASPKDRRHQGRRQIYNRDAVVTVGVVVRGLCLTRDHNVIRRSLKPLPLEKFDFIGFHQTFMDDIFVLASLMRWPEARLSAWISSANVTANANHEFPHSARVLPDRALTLIRLVNAVDREIYNQALRLRASSLRKEPELAGSDARCDES